MEYQGSKGRVERIMDCISGNVTAFTQKLVQTRSVTCQGEEVAVFVKEKMYQLSYDKVTMDETGNVFGRMGDGATALVLDSHMDTVSVTDEELWDDPPFDGVMKDGRLYGRGAVDMKYSLVASVYGAYVAKETGLLGDVAIYISTSTMEEDLDGEAVRQLLQNTGLRPGGMIICEPTSLKIVTGHRGRTLIKVKVEGRSCHANNPSAGLNPVYLMEEVIDHVQQRASTLDAGESEKGSVALTNVYCSTPSNNSIPQDASIVLGRRLALGEAEGMVSKEMDGLMARTKEQWHLCGTPTPSWADMDLAFHSFLPTWSIEPEHPLAAAASQVYRLVKSGEPVLFRVGTSTGGVTTTGMFHLPTITFGSSDLAQAHSANEYCSVESMLDARQIYAALCGKIEKL